MRARRLVLDGGNDAVIAAAAAHLRSGGLVAFPTETVYGLGADAANRAACARVYAVKGRPADNPLIVHFASTARVVAALGSLPEPALRLAERYWPGPLTLVLRRPQGAFQGAAAALDSVAVRVPAHPVAAALLAAAGVAVAAPSANLSGRPSPTDGESVWRDLQAAAADRDVSDVWLLDAGPSGLGLESTVVDLTGERPHVLRPGALALEAIAAVVGPLMAGGDGRRSPGTRHRHYAPALPLILFEAAAPAEAVVAVVRDRAGDAALLAPPARAAAIRAAAGPLAGRLRTFPLGADADDEGLALARDLFRALRWCEEAGVAYALAELPAAGGGLRPAIRDRLWRAADGHVVGVVGS